MTNQHTSLSVGRSGELLALADRVEAATGPDRELDALVAASQIRAIEKTSFGAIEAWAAAAISNRWNFPRFTASLDAAMALVPQLHTLFHLCGPYSDNRSRATIAGGRPVCFYEVTAVTPALALCAAALRAQATNNTISEETGR